MKNRFFDASTFLLAERFLEIPTLPPVSSPLAVAIVFVYYIVLTVFSFVSQAFVTLAPLWAWVPNIIFTAIGLARLRRAALE